MNLLPTMLVATTLATGGSLAANPYVVNVNQLQGQFNKNCENQQVVLGNASELESILKNLGVSAGTLEDCLNNILPGGTLSGGKVNIQIPGWGENSQECDTQIKPETPGTGTPETKPETKPETPDTETKPETPNPGTPETKPETPETKPETPNTGTPGTKPETPNPGTPETPDAETPKEDSDGQDLEKGYAEQVVDLVNVERAKAGLPALKMNSELNKAALIRSKETTQSFSHTRPNGSSFSSVLSENGISYRGAGENIAWGQPSPEAVVNAWMNSAGHRANILNKNYTSIGVGCYLYNTNFYWAQLFTY